MAGCARSERSPASAPTPSRESPPPRPSPSPLVTEKDSVAGALLDAHNAWRDRYGVPPLAWSEELAEVAQDWANRLALDNDGLRHRQPNRYGENLYWIHGRPATPIEVVAAWGGEEELYHPAKNNWWPDAAHFSQLVWRTTERVGCAVARRGAAEWWVCNYDPPGNVKGQRPY